jgi:methylase of polypeptide subunit release factors
VLIPRPETETLVDVALEALAAGAAAEPLVLDVGTGSGCIALALAAEDPFVRVVASDVDATALAVARGNAARHGLEGRVSFVAGDLFAALAGEARFDLVVSNPPYVISPESSYTFRDGGRPGDALSAEVVRGAAAHLEEGGFATVLCNWALAEGEDPFAPPRRWVEGTGCDAWIVDGGRQDPLEYAALWNRSRDGAAYGEALDRWTASCARQAIASIGLGAVVLRRRGGAASWVRVDAPGAARGSAHEHILRIFEAQDLLGAAGDGAFLAHRFRAAADHRVVQVLVPGNGGYAASSLLRLEGGLGFEGGVDLHGFRLVRSCDGQRALGEVVEEVCRDPAVERASVIEVARQLVSLGFLVRAGPPEGPGKGRDP